MRAKNWTHKHMHTPPTHPPTHTHTHTHVLADEAQWTFFTHSAPIYIAIATCKMERRDQKGGSDRRGWTEGKGTERDEKRGRGL